MTRQGINGGRSANAPEQAILAAQSRRDSRPMPQLQLIHGKRETTFGKARFRAIAPLVELDQVPKPQRFPRLLPDGSRAWSATQIVAWCAKENGRCVRTVRRSLALFRRGGKGALERCPRADKGSARFFGRHRAAAVFAAYLHLAWRPSVRAVHQSILRNRESLGLSGVRLPCYETARAWLRTGRQALAPLAVEGQNLYRALAFSEADRGSFYSTEKLRRVHLK